MNADPVANLLEDAHLVLDYAVRAGRLPDESLPTAIKEMQSGPESGMPLSLIALSNAMSAAVAAIRPVTVMDLRAGRSPFEASQQSSVRRTQYALCCITAILSGLIAFYSFALLRGESALRDYQTIERAQIPEKIFALRRLVQQDNVFKKRDALYQQYLRELQQIKDLLARWRAAQAMLVNLKEDPWWPFERDFRRATQWVSKAMGLGDSTTVAGLPDPVGLKFSPYEAPDSKENDICAREETAGASTPQPQETAPMAWRKGLADEKIDEFCFMRELTLGLTYGNANYFPLAESAGSIRDRIALLSTWILPFLTGLLGAAVFLLRDSMSPYSASFDKPRIVVRLAIGGVAGIIIGWFWTPTSLMETELSKASSLPLALAFLVGYSIDILFSALERMRSSLTAAQEPAKPA